MVASDASITARIYAQAAGKLDTGVVDNKTRQRIDQYQDRALQLLRQGLDYLPGERRAVFWRDMIQNDLAMNSLRPLKGFLELAKDYNRKID